MGVAFFVLIMTNFIMNVAAIAITLPVALVMAPYIGVEPEVVMFAALAAAGMPFLLLVGAAPNAIAFESHQFRTEGIFPVRDSRQRHPAAGASRFSSGRSGPGWACRSCSDRSPSALNFQALAAGPRLEIPSPQKLQQGLGKVPGRCDNRWPVRSSLKLRLVHPQDQNKAA